MNACPLQPWLHTELMWGGILGVSPEDSDLVRLGIGQLHLQKFPK